LAINGLRYGPRHSWRIWRRGSRRPPLECMLPTGQTSCALLKQETAPVTRLAYCISWTPTSMVHGKIRLYMYAGTGAKRQFRSNGSSGCCALLASAGSLTTSLRFSLSHVTSMMVRLVLVSPLATNRSTCYGSTFWIGASSDLLIQSQAPLTNHGLGRVKINTSNALYISTALY
jgi:hypothetical protein